MERRNEIKKLERPEISGTEDNSLDEYIKQKKLKDAQIDKEMAERQKQQIQEIEERKALNREKTYKKKMYWISLSVEKRKKLLLTKKKEKCIKKIKNIINILFNLSVFIILTFLSGFVIWILGKMSGRF